MPKEPTEMVIDVVTPFGGFKFITEPTGYNLATASAYPVAFGTAVWIIEGYLVTLRNPVTVMHMLAHKANNVLQLGRAGKVVLQGAARAAPAASLIATEAYMTHELYGGMTKNLGMSEVGHTGSGAYTNPFEGGSNDEVYYPGKSLVDWVMSW
jgi:hypothetical protein